MARGGPREGAGRPKGSTSKVRQKITELLLEQSYDPLEGMIAMLEDDNLSQDIRFKIHEHISNKVYPKIGPIDYFQFKVQNGLNEKIDF